MPISDCKKAFIILVLGLLGGELDGPNRGREGRVVLVFAYEGSNIVKLNLLCKGKYHCKAYFLFHWLELTKQVNLLLI